MEMSTVKSAALLAYDLIRANTPPGILPSGVCCVYCCSSLKERNVVYKVNFFYYNLWVALEQSSRIKSKWTALLLIQHSWNKWRLKVHSGIAFIECFLLDKPRTDKSLTKHYIIQYKVIAGNVPFYHFLLKCIHGAVGLHQNDTFFVFIQLKKQNIHI